MQFTQKSTQPVSKLWANERHKPLPPSSFPSSTKSRQIRVLNTQSIKERLKKYINADQTNTGRVYKLSSHLLYHQLSDETTTRRPSPPPLRLNDKNRNLFYTTGHVACRLYRTQGKVPTTHYSGLPRSIPDVCAPQKGRRAGGFSDKVHFKPNRREDYTVNLP